MNQHFVPRAYLKNFAERVRNDYYINAFDKLNNRYFRVNIKKICSEIDFYTLPKDNAIAEDILAIEKIYANSIEPMYLRAYKLLVNNNVFEITDLQRVEIIIGVLHFHTRNPKFLRRSLSIHSEDITRLYNEEKSKGAKGITYFKEDFSFRDFDLADIIKYFSQKIIKEFKESHIISTKNLTDFHNNAKIEINIARDKANFITGDNPLAMEDFFSKTEQPLLRSTEFILPLNKKFLLKLYHDNRKKANFIYRSFIPDGNVNFANELVFNQSSKFLFGDKEDFDEYFKTQEFFTKDSLELRVDFARQVLELIPESEDNKASHKVLRDYYEKYQNDGYVNPDEEQIMMRAIRQYAIEFKNRIIN